MKKKLTIALNSKPSDFPDQFRAFYRLTFAHMTRGSLVVLLKHHGLPVPKLKSEMTNRLAEHFVKANRPTSIVIG